MIKNDVAIDFGKSAVFGCDLANQVMELYRVDPERGKELALAAIVFVMTGGTEISDDPIINIILSGNKSFVTKNAEKWQDRKEEKEEYSINKKQLGEIAQMTIAGFTQEQIAAQLGLSRPTIARRIKLIRDKYPYLLENNSPDM